MKFRHIVSVGFLLVQSLVMSAEPKAFPKAPAQTAQNRVSPQGVPTANEGERVFKQNCSRCHNAPEGFSPNISGTIVRHMRVRANLSERDMQDLLRFFNP